MIYNIISKSEFKGGDISGSMCQKYILDFVAFYEQIYIDHDY